jgi:pantoate--beta-alanine ligase
MSSRNAYLEPAERERATAIHRALITVAERARAGSLAAGLEAGMDELRLAGIDPEYLEARDAESLAPVEEIGERQVLVAVAARVGGARLIDNEVIDP